MTVTPADPGPDRPPPVERAIRNPLDPRNPLAGIYLATTLF